jgi:endoglucanase
MRQVLIAFLVLLLMLGAGAAAARAGGETPPGAGYWHTSGTQIVDSSGRPVRIAGVTWYGMESSHWVPAGLEHQPYTAIMDMVKKLGYNTIRLPYSNQLVETNPIVTKAIEANPQFKGMRALQVMDAIVDYAQKIGLKIILDDHLSRALDVPRVNYLEEPLWYSAQFPESSWIRDWEMLARRYLDRDAVIGFDLRNEPHTGGVGPWTLHSYLTQGATWGPYRGVDNPATDWWRAAERAGNAILAINPHLLMFVEGVELYANPHTGSGTMSYWWGSILTPAKRYPVVFNVPHQLVYSSHDWGPWKWNMRWFKGMTYQSMLTVWHEHWSFLLDKNNPNAAPIWLGEFGTCTWGSPCLDDVKGSAQARWFHLLLRFLKDHPGVGWSFFALNGSNSNDSPANNGLLNRTWDDLANPALQADLVQIQH